MTNLKIVTHSVKNEFKRKRCGCDHDPPDDFFKSQWQSRTKSSAYLIYRWIIALFFTAVVIYSMIDSDSSRGFWLYFIYLTNWGIIMCMITNCLVAVLVSIWHLHPNYVDKLLNMESIICPFRVYWSFHIITLVVSIVITTIYWSVLYDPEYISLSATNIMTHALNSILMFIDLLIVAHPLRLLHIFLPVCFGLIYSIFSFTYQKCGGVNMLGQPYIYPILDWEQFDKAFLITFGIMLLSCCVYMILFVVYKLRLTFFKYINNGSFYPPIISQPTENKNVEMGAKEASLESGIKPPPSGISMTMESVSSFQNQTFSYSKDTISK